MVGAGAAEQEPRESIASRACPRLPASRLRISTAIDTPSDFPDDTWATNSNFWKPDQTIPFVNPEWDSVGHFLIGVYRHHLLMQQNPAAARPRLHPCAPGATTSSAPPIGPERSGSAGGSGRPLTNVDNY